MGHELVFMSKVSLSKPDPDEPGSLVPATDDYCQYKNCKHQHEGENPKIDFMNEDFYACQYVFTCLYAVHVDCYGGEPKHLRHRHVEELLELDSEEGKESESGSEEEMQPLGSYIQEVEQEII